MKNLSTMAATSALLCVIPVVLAQAAAPALNTSWWTTNKISQGECMDKASAALRAVGMTTKLEVVRESTRGEKGDYIGLVRCAEKAKVAFFAVAGPDAQECSKLGQSLEEEFKKAKAGRK